MISVVIVNFNVKYFLELCLCAVQKAQLHYNVEIIVVDNHSDDDSKAYLENRFPAVQFIWLKENIGFGRASNVGANIALGEWILFLNPDTVVPENCFTACISFLAEHEDAGALGIKMIDGNGCYLKESKRGFPSPSAAFYKLFGLAVLFPRSKYFSQYYLGHLPANQSAQVEVLAGAFMLLKKSAFIQTRGFDEAYFMYGEDIDLSWRIKKAGYQNYYFAETPIIHFKGESTVHTDPFYTHHFYNAMRIFAEKNFGDKRSLKSSLLKLGIQCRKKIADIFTCLPKQAAVPDHFFLLGDEAYTARVQKALIARNITASVITKNQISKLSPQSNIIFCEGETLSFAAIIKQLQIKPKHVNAFIKANNAGSVVGSPQKNTRGLAFEL